MKEWLTAREFAEERLPHLPANRTAMIEFAEREGWNDHPSFARKRAGRGGGMEYHYRILPTLAQVAYKQKHMRLGIVDLPPAANDSPEPAAETLSGRAALERDARLAIVKHFERFREGLTLRQASALQIFSDKYNARSLHVSDWVLEIIPRLSKGSLKRWIQKARSGAQLGVDRSLARKGTGSLDTANGGDVKTFVLGLVAHQPHLSGAHIRTQIRAEFGDRLNVVSKGAQKAVEVPDVRAIQRFVAALKAEHAVLLTKLTNPDQFRSTKKLRGTGTLRHITAPGGLWQIDASPVDALCTDGRHSVYVCIDIATRRVILTLSRTARAAAVGLLIRKAVLEWGVPEAIKIDNGSDFKAKATERLFASLGIEVDYSAPYSPQEKGFVERVIGTFQRDAVALVPGFVGHSVADRKAIESRRAFAQRLGEDDANTFAVQYSAAEMQAVFDDWSRLHYQHQPHSGLKGRTPFEVASSAAQTMRTVDPRALDLLLAPIADAGGYRVFTPQGFKVAGAHYLNGRIMVGTRAFIRHDPTDMGRVYAFGSEDGDFLGEALCAELAGIPPEVFVRAEKERQAEMLAEIGAAAEAVRRKLRGGPALIERAREVWLRDQPNVTPLPRPTTEHKTRDIAAVLDAIQPPSRATAGKLTGRAAEIHAEMLAERARAGSKPAVPPPSNVTPLQTPQTRFKRALELEAAIAAGDDVAAKDALWLGGYQAGPEYGQLLKLRSEFGDRMRL